MSDLKLVFTAGVGADFVIEGNDLAIDEGLVPSMELSLLTDRRAPDGTITPDGSGDLRGWWATVLLSEAGDEYGSLLWLLSRQKATADVLKHAETHASDALQWMLRDGIAGAIDVSAEFLNGHTIGVTVIVTKPDGSSLTQQFALVWNAQAQQGAN